MKKHAAWLVLPPSDIPTHCHAVMTHHTLLCRVTGCAHVNRVVSSKTINQPLAGCFKTLPHTARTRARVFCVKLELKQLQENTKVVSLMCGFWRHPPQPTKFQYPDCFMLHNKREDNHRSTQVEMHDKSVTHFHATNLAVDTGDTLDSSHVVDPEPLVNAIRADSVASLRRSIQAVCAIQIAMPRVWCNIHRFRVGVKKT